MKLLCKTKIDFDDWKEGVIVGYCPGQEGRVNAIVARVDGALEAVPLFNVRLISSPKKLDKFDRKLFKNMESSSKGVA
jgi:hypothetical protein